MSASWEQAAAIIGVVVGALLSFALSAMTDRVRWRRDAAVRWDPQRMSVYADYAFAVREMYQVVLTTTTQHGHRLLAPVSPEGSAALEEAETERAARFEAVLLIGDPRTVAAARRWHQALWHLECFARGQLTDHTEWAAAMREFGEARAGYYRAARHDLGIAGGLPPTSTPAWKTNLVPQVTRSVGSGSESGPHSGQGSLNGEGPLVPDGV